MQWYGALAAIMLSQQAIKIVKQLTERANEMNGLKKKKHNTKANAGMMHATS